MLMGQKYKVHRSAVLELVQRICGTDLTALASDAELVVAIRVLDRIKAFGLNAAAVTEDELSAGA
jgi:hypothetical protein